jgi:chitin synthase
LLRWDAIKGAPIEKFLKGLHSDKLSLFKCNMFLAEDRIMCWQIIVQHFKDNNAYGMMYLPGAKAVTDPPESFIDLLKQRRRWINGSNAAFFYTVTHFKRIAASSHSCIQKLAFYLNMFFLIISQFLGFVGSGIFYGGCAVFLNTYAPQIVATWFKNIVILAFMILVSISVTMGGKGLRSGSVVNWLERVYYFFTFANLFIFLAAIYTLFLDAQLASYILITIFLATFFLPSIIYDPADFFCHPKQSLLGIICYVLTMPMYSIIFQEFAFCNWCDISWGNRGKSEDSQIKEKD